jgi:E3 ubiquitin-protein ligase UBR1
MYYEATVRRHGNQIARHHPEQIERLEFVCPLCKALGNAFLPIIWRGQEESYPGALQTRTPFGSFLDQQLHSAYYALGASRPPDEIQNNFADYASRHMIPNLSESSSQLIDDAWRDPESQSVAVGTPFSDAFPNVPTPESNSRPNGPPDSNTMLRELVAVCRRLRDTLRKNSLHSRHHLDTGEADRDELYSSDTLVRSLGFSISAVEIQQRGIDADYGLTFLDKIPEQVLTHLRILAETVDTYISTGGLREAGENLIDTEYRKDSERQHCQLFMAQYIGEETDNTRRPADVYPPLLRLDPFVFFCECVFGVGTAQGFEVGHLMRLCYLAEITKVVYQIGRNNPATLWLNQIINRPRDMKPQLRNFAEFCETLVKIDMQTNAELRSISNDLEGENKGFDQQGLDTVEGWYNFTKKYALAFLRKCIILLYVRFGVDFNGHMSLQPELVELDRLTEALRIPSFDEMLTALTSLGPQYDWPSGTPRLVAGWIKHQILWLGSRNEHDLPPSALISHPGIFELVGLPKNYDTLIEECTRRRCPTTGKDISDPIICLFCGDIFCGQGICCMKEEKLKRGKSIKIGGAQQHMRK